MERIEEQNTHMETIDVFRQGVREILAHKPRGTQKRLAIAIGVSSQNFSDFLHGRVNYPDEKREKIATLLGTTYIDLLNFGKKVLGSHGKIASLKDKRLSQRILLKDGSSCALLFVLKMTEEILMEQSDQAQLGRSILIENIFSRWKEISHIKHKLKKGEQCPASI